MAECHITGNACNCTAPQLCHPSHFFSRFAGARNDITPSVVLQHDGTFTAIDVDTYDCDHNGHCFFSTSPMGYGRTPLDAIVDLLDQIGSEN